MSLEAELSTDIVTVIPSIDSSKLWFKIARDRIRLGADNIRSPGFFSGIPMHQAYGGGPHCLAGAQLMIVDQPNGGRRSIRI